MQAVIKASTVALVPEQGTAIVTKLSKRSSLSSGSEVLLLERFASFESTYFVVVVKGDVVTMLKEVDGGRGFKHRPLTEAAANRVFVRTLSTYKEA